MARLLRSYGVSKLRQPTVVGSATVFRPVKVTLADQRSVRAATSRGTTYVVRKPTVVGSATTFAPVSVTTVPPPRTLRRYAHSVLHPPTATAGPVSYNDSGTCVLTFSGSSTETHAHTGSGTVVLTLTGTRTESQAHVGSGTAVLTFAGSSTESQAHVGSGTAVLTFGGSGSEVYSPPGGVAYTFVSNVLAVLRRRGLV